MLGVIVCDAHVLRACVRVQELKALAEHERQNHARLDALLKARPEIEQKIDSVLAYLDMCCLSLCLSYLSLAHIRLFRVLSIVDVVVVVVVVVDADLVQR